MALGGERQRENEILYFHFSEEILGISRFEL